MFEFKVFPELQTERLLLNEITPYDQQAIFAIFHDEMVTRYNNIQTFSAIEDAEWFLNFMSRRFYEGRGISWAMRLRSKPEELIGIVGFNSWNRRTHFADMGYDLAQSYWGWGLVPEALGAVIDLGFEQMALNRIEAEVTVDNRQSSRVLEKLGFTREGVLRQRGCWKGAFHDLILYSLLRSDRE